MTTILNSWIKNWKIYHFKYLKDDFQFSTLVVNSFNYGCILPSLTNETASNTCRLLIYSRQHQFTNKAKLNTSQLYIGYLRPGPNVEFHMSRTLWSSTFGPGLNLINVKNARSYKFYKFNVGFQLKSLIIPVSYEFILCLKKTKHFIWYVNNSYRYKARWWYSQVNHENLANSTVLNISFLVTDYQIYKFWQFNNFVRNYCFAKPINLEQTVTRYNNCF